MSTLDIILAEMADLKRKVKRLETLEFPGTSNLFHLDEDHLDEDPLG
jgi:hypothetical protein